MNLALVYQNGSELFLAHIIPTISARQFETANKELVPGDDLI